MWMKGYVLGSVINKSVQFLKKKWGSKLEELVLQNDYDDYSYEEYLIIDNNKK